MLILGHRGAADAAHPENTVAAVDRALREGADGVEVDVRLTRDADLVCVHDATLARVAGIDAEVARLDASGLAALRLPGGHAVPTLAGVVDAVRGRGRLVVELKTYGAPDAARTLTGVVLAAELRRLGVTRRDDVVVSSFDRVALATFARRSGVRTAVVTPAGVPAETALRWALDGDHDEVHPHVRALLAARPGLVRDAHAVGVSVAPWTVNRRSDLRHVAARGADAAICDDPAGARAALLTSTRGLVG